MASRVNAPIWAARIATQERLSGWQTAPSIVNQTCGPSVQTRQRRSITDHVSSRDEFEVRESLFTFKREKNDDAERFFHFTSAR